ncbi:MAG TPA: LuxR C-terminal-related transcriptional regulator [Solirubrobacterales bacterium]|nr:LuxR C-terminal-related transcriptional regulator [Solirubrobacterales bacterium]
MTSPNLPGEEENAQVFTDETLHSQEALRLRTALERSRHPMLIADDQRRWVTGNLAACDLLGIAREEIPWRTMDDFTPPEERKTLEEKWAAFLSAGGAEGWYQLYVPDRGSVPVEFSATANVLPARHLSVFIPAAGTSAEQGGNLPHEMAWEPVAKEEAASLQLTEREREIMTLVASGLQSGDIAERLFLSPETVKSHVHNALEKLGAHTRAHAVAIALVRGQISWEV